MNALKQLFVVCMLGWALAVQAADGSHAYFAFDTGPAFQQDLKVKEALGVSVSAGKIGFDPGIRFDVSGGYNFNDTLAVGIETGVLYNNIHRLTSGGVSASPAAIFGADVSFFQVPILANAIFTPPLRSPLRPFVGAGAGGVASVIAGSTIDTESDFTFAYEGIAGFAYAIAPRIDIGHTYKFLGATDHKFDSIKTGETYAHSILATFTFKF